MANATESKGPVWCSSPWALAVAMLCLVWAYGETLAGLARQWSHDPQYSHGYLVPVFALVLLYFRRELMARAEWRPLWWGLFPLILGLASWIVGTHYHLSWIEAISFLPCTAALVFLVGGKAAWRWAWPAVGFLAFMVPLPYRAAVALTDPLQRFATILSTFALQTLGFPAVAEGNVILLSEVELGIVEACSGLRMLVIFFALAAAVALLIRRPLWEKVVLVASAAPIALAANVARITATGMLHELVGSRLANAVFHDFAGWVMMPLALTLLWLELRILARLFLEQPGQRGMGYV
jgi:exosortase